MEVWGWIALWILSLLVLTIILMKIFDAQTDTDVQCYLIISFLIVLIISGMVHYHMNNKQESQEEKSVEIQYLQSEKIY